MAGASFAAAVAVAGAASAEQINIAPQPLTSALNEFGHQTKSSVVFTPDLTASKASRGAANSSDPETALQEILNGTGLTFKRSGDAFLIMQQEGGSSPQDASAGDVDALIVTAQKKEEAIQDVPIAISAFTQKSLDAQKIEGGFDLLKAIPNVTFSKSNFSGYNFSIRGIGTKAVSATTDPAVAVSFNNIALIHNRLFEQEYFDVDRVEVLRGPQGTLYGRNATSGVINVISAKPRLGEFEGDIKLEAGNFNAKRVRGMVNVPVGETLAVRLAGALTKRDAYGLNLANGEDVDGRDLWSARMSLGWEPVPWVRANLMWEHFEEDDNRVRTSKQLCQHDPGLSSVAGTVVPDGLTQGALSQGCLPGSLYDESAYGTPNGLALPFISIAGDPIASTIGFRPASYPVCGSFLLTILNPCQRDPYGNRTQSRDLRTIESLIEPVYRAKADVVQLNVDLDLTEGLSLSSQTALNKDEVYSTQDFNRFRTLPVFSDTAAACGEFVGCSPGTFQGGYFRDLTPGGVFNDPQLGPSNSIMGQDISSSRSTQFTQEFRLQSNFDAPVNFSLGAHYTRFRTNDDYFVFFNMLTLFNDVFFNFNQNCRIRGLSCVYTDHNPLESINGDGHNYFRSKNPYRLSSAAAFGEVYWQVTESLKFTGGLRWTWDRKTFVPVPSQTLLSDYRELNTSGIPLVSPGAGPETCTIVTFCGSAGSAVGGRGYPALPPIVQEWREPTGRLGLDWKPELSFTDETMVYGFYSHGYKAGGANPPGISSPAGLFIAAAQGAVTPPVFEPEFVDAFEVGTKNTLLGGALVLNGSAFYYDYEGYQVSKIVDRSAANENIDSRVYGVELEWIYSPTRNLRFNGTFGALRTDIADGEQSLDLMDRTQGDPDWVVVKPSVLGTSNCVAPAATVATAIQRGVGSTALASFCPGGDLFGNNYLPGSSYSNSYGIIYNPATDAPNGGAGFLDDIGGNELPNAPHWTASLGAQYRMALPGGWDATLRGDIYYQSQSYSRIYNTQYDKLRAWTNTNLSLWAENPEWGVTAEVYVKNVFDETPITDAFLNSDDTALTTNVFTLDPRLVGVSVRKSF